MEMLCAIAIIGVAVPALMLMRRKPAPPASPAAPREIVWYPPGTTFGAPAAKRDEWDALQDDVRADIMRTRAVGKSLPVSNSYERISRERAERLAGEKHGQTK